jgi:arginine decarboxylase
MDHRGDVEVVWGRGEAGTPLSAFDAALAEGGIHNYNLVTYSSILPPERSVATPGRATADYGVGTPVGVVLAANETGRTGAAVAAGLGWLRAEEGGVLMESTADSTAACRDDLRRKLADARELRDWNWRGEAETVVRDHVVAADGTDAGRERAGAVVVAAVYGPLATAGDR